MTSRLADKISAAELLHEITAIVREEIGYEDPFAGQIAEAITRGLCRRRPGERIYIPAAGNMGRDARIRAEFNGRNLAEVMARFGVSKATVYRAAK